MKKDLTELVFVLDRSGSMSGLEEDTIGGFNSMIEKQKKEDGEAYVSVVLFDDRTDVIYDRVDIKKIEPMTDSTRIKMMNLNIVILLSPRSSSSGSGRGSAPELP